MIKEFKIYAKNWIWMKDWRLRAASMGGLFFIGLFPILFSKLGLTKKSNRQKVLEKNSKNCANLFIFAPNINTIVWMCFSTQFFSTEFDFEVKNDPRWLIKSCFVKLDLPFHQIGHKWPLFGILTQDL